MVTISPIVYVNDFVVFNASCLSVKCQGPIEEKLSMCCQFGSRPQGRLSVDYNLRLDTIFFLFSRVIRDIMPRNMPQHDLSCCQHRAILSVRKRVWSGLTVSFLPSSDDADDSEFWQAHGYFNCYKSTSDCWISGPGSCQMPTTDFSASATSSWVGPKAPSLGPSSL